MSKTKKIFSSSLLARARKEKEKNKTLKDDFRKRQMHNDSSRGRKIVASIAAEKDISLEDNGKEREKKKENCTAWVERGKTKRGTNKKYRKKKQKIGKYKEKGEGGERYICDYPPFRFALFLLLLRCSNILSPPRPENPPSLFLTKKSFFSPSNMERVYPLTLPLLHDLILS